jgi:TrmH family RNA methyltransferase
MISKVRIKFLNSLHLKKFRQEHKAFLVEGNKTTTELLASGYKVQSLYATKSWLETHRAEISGKKTEVFEATAEELKVCSTHSQPDEVIAVAGMPEAGALPVLEKGQLYLALDSINDPGNMGAIIRIADWFGVKHILCSEDCVDAYNPKTVSAAKGSLFRTGITYTRLQDVFAAAGHTVYGALLQGENIYTQDLGARGILLIGNEANGISPALLPYITHAVSIPRFGQAESLNAAMATAILCSEFMRPTALHP